MTIERMSVPSVLRVRLSWHAVSFGVASELVLDETLDAELTGRHLERRIGDLLGTPRFAVEGDERFFRSGARLEAVERRARFAARHLLIVMDDQHLARHERAVDHDRVPEIHD